MNNRATWLAVAAVVVIAAVVFFALRKPAPEIKPAPPPPAVKPEARRVRPKVHRPLAPVAEPTGAVAEVVVEQPAPPVAPAPPSEPVAELRADEQLAIVNGIPILARDLVSYPAANQAAVQGFSNRFLAMLLDRAIKRELTLQAAKARGLELTEAQRAQLDEVRATVQRRQGGDPGAIFLTNQGSLEEQAAFEMRDATALMFQDSLLQAEGVPPPEVTNKQVEEYYLAHRQEFPPLPEDDAAAFAAWSDISTTIRVKLMPEVGQAYEEQRQALLAKLRAQGAVTEDDIRSRFKVPSAAP